MSERIYRHINRTVVEVSFSECGKYRYTLTVDYKPAVGKKSVCAIMQNPSYACKEYADKSVQFLEKLIFQKGYEEFAEVGRLIVVNQFAFVETNNFKGRKEQIGSENDQAIEASLDRSEIGLIAWGKANPFEERKMKILGLIATSSLEAIYLTKKHPSRGFYADFIEDYKI